MSWYKLSICRGFFSNIMFDLIHPRFQLVKDVYNVICFFPSSSFIESWSFPGARSFWVCKANVSATTANKNTKIIFIFASWAAEKSFSNWSEITFFGTFYSWRQNYFQFVAHQNQIYLNLLKWNWPRRNLNFIFYSHSLSLKLLTVSI